MPVTPACATSGYLISFDKPLQGSRSQPLLQHTCRDTFASEVSTTTSQTQSHKKMISSTEPRALCMSIIQYAWHVSERALQSSVI